MTSRRAECSCGQLKVTCNGEPVRVSVCRCTACQRRTGSPFGQQARLSITFRFCPTCASTVYFDIDKMPGFIAVPVGAFANATFPAPKASMYESRKHAWLNLPEGIEHVD